jgi:uncharacterized protein YbjT (DUF2867 family)
MGETRKDEKRSQAMIVVMGATGNTGGVVAARLLENGRRVRAIGRSAETLGALKAKGADTAVGDASDAAFLTSAFNGADAVYALVPPDLRAVDAREHQLRIGRSIAEALRRARVGNVVFLSSIGAEQPEGTGPIAGLHRVEKTIEELGIDALFLRAGYFMDNAYGSLPLIRSQGMNGGLIRGSVPIAMVATPDIGRVAADALLRLDFEGTSRREVIGPRDYSLGEITRIIGEKIGKPDLAYVELSEADFRSALAGAGISPSVADAFVEIAQAINDGKVRSLEGRSAFNTTPTTFETFADRLAEAYRAM